ncbi:MAG TPA: nuclear transport factor 2 family protein [Solirubrobacteraceae bacterium]|nr:nuclear transport factor 2 family protein [Solirubrobacteraceae bacterium]
MSESNVELVRRGYEAVMRGDLDVIAEILDPDVKWHAGDPTAGYACHNRQQAVAFMRRNWLRRGAPPGELVDMIDAGDKVVLIMRRTGEDGGPELVANLTTFRNGKVIEMVHYPNPDDARAAAGV